MSELNNQLNLTASQKGYMKLMEDLVRFNPSPAPAQKVDIDMLSMVVSDALKGVDISKRYPAFYLKILNDADLRQSFMDALGTMENQSQAESVALPLPVKPSLDFLSHTHPVQQPTITQLGANKWRSIWRQSIEQLQSIFSPPQLAYRSDPSLYEDPWITLLRGETEIGGATYAFMLECSPAENSDEALSVAINLAITLMAPAGLPKASLATTLQWGSYNETVAISEEGRTSFPDIPLTEILDEGQQNFKAELSLSLEKTS